jgi:hypothetical protein
LFLPFGDFYFFGFGADAPSQKVSEQGLCQADNRLIFLAFSAPRRGRSGPHRSKLDGDIVPRRNTSTTTPGEREKFGFLSV